MDVRTTVKTALSGLCSGNIYWNAYDGDNVPPAQYITFTVREYDALYASDLSTETEYTVYVELYSDVDPASVPASVKSAMIGAGFACAEIMDTGDTDPYHISMTFNWVGA